MNYKSSLTLLLIFCFILNSCQKEQNEDIFVDADVSQVQAHLEQLKGKQPVLVNVWATWCIPCVEEFPYLMELNRKYKGEFELVLISGDFEEAIPDAKEFLKEQNVDFKTFHKVGKDNDFINGLSEEWTGALPFTMVIDIDGNVVSSWEGAAEFEQFETELKKVLK